MKWFLVGVACLLGPVTWLRADPSADLIQSGEASMAQANYPAAAEAFAKVVSDFPTTANIEDIRIRAAFAYLHANNFSKAIDFLSPLLAPATQPEFRGRALFFTGLAQFLQGGQQTDKTEISTSYQNAADSFLQLITLIGQSDTPEIKDLLEEATYYRALAEYQNEKYDDAANDLNQLLAQFGSSLSRPDYLLLLGSIHAVNASNDIKDKKPDDVVRADAQKALDTFDLVSKDPNALVQGNEANMRKADVLFLVAQLDLPNTDGYAKALEAFRTVRRKEDMIPIQQARLDQLRASAAKSLSNGTVNATSSDSRLIEREENRLTDLKNAPDLVIRALIRIADSYNAMKMPDEARTVLHRLKNATLTPPLNIEQMQDIDFQLIYSYTLGGQTEKANAALTDYLVKHPGDPQADSISVEIASSLLQRKDYQGALTQALRSQQDFPSGKQIGQAVTLQAQALTGLGKVDEASKVIDDYVASNANSPQANALMVSQGQIQMAKQDIAGALESFRKVKDNNGAGELQPAAAALYINALQSQGRYNDVINESKAFAAKYPSNPSLPSVLLIQALAMDKKNDPAAVTALQAIARKYPKNTDASPYALYYVVTIEQRQNKIPEMLKAVDDLRKAFPKSYELLIQAFDSLSDVLGKAKRFDEAIAAYQPLVSAPKPSVAAAARNKIGMLWIAAARASGSYQSLAPGDPRTEAEKKIAAAEDSFIGTLKTYPNELSAVDGAFQGLNSAMLLRKNWGLIKDTDYESYLTKVGDELAAPGMQTRLELAKAGLVFTAKNGAAQFPAALDRFNKALDSNPGMVLTRTEAMQYGELLITAKDYPKALAVYQNLLASAPNDPSVQAEADYGIGSVYFAQNDRANAKKYFDAMKSLPGGAAWSPHIMQANLDLALINEQSGNPAEMADAKATYASLMQSPQAGALLQAKATLGYGRLLEKAGAILKRPNQQDIEYAVHYYEQVANFYAAATPAESAEALFRAGQAYGKAGDTADATRAYSALRAGYDKTAPDWVAKIPAT